MRARLIRLANQLHESYWFVPTMMAIAALLLAAGMVWLDSHNATGWLDRIPWLYASRPDGARSVLSSVGGSMLGVAGTTFSVTIAAVVYASGQHGPQLLSNFMSDRGNQVTLGTFIATFLYSLFVVHAIRSPGESGVDAGFVPQLAVLVGIVLVLCSIAVLIYFIHHVPSRIHINNVIERIGDRLLKEIDHRYPVFVGHPLQERPDDPRIPAALRPAADPRDVEQRASVRAHGTGYIQLIDQEKLIDAARRAGLVLRLQYQPGDFVHRGSVLADVWPARAMDEDVASVLRDTVAIGARRTALQDMRFLVDELVEIAARSLSSGINDPFTASSCLDWLGAAIADLVRRDLPSRLRADVDGDLRVITHPVSFADFVDQAFGGLARYASADMIAARRFLAALGEVALSCEAPERMAVLRRHIEQFRTFADDALSGADRDAVLRRADQLLRALADPEAMRRQRDGDGWLGGTA